jgi:hypothetical protein
LGGEPNQIDRCGARLGKGVGNFIQAVGGRLGVGGGFAVKPWDGDARGTTTREAHCIGDEGSQD